MKPRKTAEMKTPMRIPLTTERKAILKKLQPLPESEYAIPDNRMETFAAGHATEHLHVLAQGSGVIGWTQPEVIARQNIEKAKEKLPKEFRWKIYTLTGAAILGDHRAVEKLAERIQTHAPDEVTRLALRAVQREPRKFIQAANALRSVDPRTQEFGTPSASKPETEEVKLPTRSRGKKK